MMRSLITASFVIGCLTSIILTNDVLAMRPAAKAPAPANRHIRKGTEKVTYHCPYYLTEVGPEEDSPNSPMCHFKSTDRDFPGTSQNHFDCSNIYGRSYDKIGYKPINRETGEVICKYNLASYTEGFTIRKKIGQCRIDDQDTASIEHWNSCAGKTKQNCKIDCLP